MKDLSKIARKAVKTRQARREFTEKYNAETLSIVRLVARGLSSSQVAERLSVSAGRVAAVRANLSRGTYRPFARVQGGRVLGKVLGA